MLTLYILKGDNPSNRNVERLFKSFGDIPITGIFLEKRDLSYAHLQTENPWFGFMYDNEYLEEGMSEALEIFLKETSFDFFTILRWCNSNMSQSPRIFRQGTHIDGLYPKNIGKLKGERILNGVILGE